jgi:TolB-like protein/Flp pilus assembly protein TadD
VFALAVVYFAFDKFVLDPARDIEMIETASQEAVLRARVEALGEKSIAVLPFDNMSSDPEQEYFADGITEELLNLLARVEGLRVISRTSAFQFKGSEKSLDDIAEQLDVVYILEGSVRRAGNTIRITAQLIDAHADAHLWSETYDREMADIFAIQDEVAARVVEELKVAMSVGLAPVERHDPEAYPLYLQASQLLEGIEPDRLERAEQLLLRDWYRSGDAYDAGDFELAEEHYARQNAILHEVAAVDPENVQLNLARAWQGMSNTAAAARYIERALDKDPHNTRALNTAMVLMMRLWRTNTARAIGEYIVKRDPLASHVQWNLARALLNSGAFEAAENTSRTMIALERDTTGHRWFLGTALLFQGEPESALEYFRQIPDEAAEYRLQGTAMALHDLGRLDESQAALARLVELTEAVPEEELRWFHGIAVTYAWIGDIDKAFDYLEQTRLHRSGNLRVAADSPFYVRLKDDPRWMPFLEAAGLAPAQLNAIEFNPRLPAEIRAAIDEDEQAGG